MKPIEILGMVEEACGTRLYEVKKSQAEKTMEKKDTFCLGGKEFSSRFILGSGKYSMDLRTFSCLLCAYIVPS